MDNDEDNPALNTDGTYKDASEMDFFRSPSDTVPLPRTSNDIVYESPSENTAARTGKGLKGKEPARNVAGRRVRKASSKAQAQCDAQTNSFFKRNFVGEHSSLIRVIRVFCIDFPLFFSWQSSYSRFRQVGFIDHWNGRAKYNWYDFSMIIVGH